MSNSADNSTEFKRRDFIKGGSLATMMTLMGGVPLGAAEEPAKPAEEKKPAGPPVKCAVIGLGAWGREILNTLLRVEQAEVAVICDTYPASLKRAGNLAPKAKTTEDYKSILADKDITAVLVATPTHLHKEIVLAAQQAGKHVYCEAPLAHTVEDARAIATAAKVAFKQVFQAGLQLRADPQNWFLLPFIRSGNVGKPVTLRAQWNKKLSWRTASPNPEREKALNWRLDKAVSSGLVGEIGIHQLDRLVWFLNALPSTASGFGGIIHWDDGRDVPDSVQAVLGFPNGVRLTYVATLANSFDGDYEMYYGSDAAIMLRGSKAWMFKEVDAPLLGWEVYARKEAFYQDTGIVLRADASKQKVAVGNKPAEEPADQKTSLYYALENFLGNAAEITAAVEDYAAAFDPKDTAAFSKYLASIKLRHAATWKDGYEATVIALKANEAVAKGEKVQFKKEWFELA